MRAQDEARNILKDWELLDNDISNSEDMESAMIEAFNRGAVLGAMDSNVLEEAQEFQEEVEELKV